LLPQGLDGRYDAHAAEVTRALRWATREATAREREACARGLVAGLARALQGSVLLTAAATTSTRTVDVLGMQSSGQSEAASLFCATRFSRSGNTGGGGVLGQMRCHYGDIPVGRPEASECNLTAIINRHSVKTQS